MFRVPAGEALSHVFINPVLCDKAPPAERGDAHSSKRLVVSGHIDSLKNERLIFEVPSYDHEFPAT
ncbi:hypothetical protein AGR5A_pb0031 [Agrobacterium genomosp. 5 str. CFBP 6626]|nr:hypothetical protein AGR5A_pb0031 [Agrobacterium genomosp. 5 str. CFBP 6626]